MPRKKTTTEKRKPGRPKGSVKTTIGKEVTQRLSRGETALYNNSRDSILRWLDDNGEYNEVTSPLMAIVLSGMAKEQPFLFDRLLLDPDLERAVDVIRAKLFARAVKKLREYAFQGGSPKWMEMYMRIIASDKDLGRLTGGVKFGEVANLTVDNRKQINVVAPPVEEKPATRKKAPKALPNIEILDVDAQEVNDSEEVQNS